MVSPIDHGDWLEYRGDIAVAMEAARRPRGTEAKVAWGGSADGLQAGIRFKALVEKPTLRVLLVLHLRNAGTKPIRMLQLLRRADYWGDHLPLKLKAGGKVLKYQGPELTPPPPPSIHDYIDLAAGATESIEVTMKPELWGLEDPHGAEIAFLFTNRSERTIAYPYDNDTEKWTEVTGLWTGTARSGMVSVTLEGSEALERPALDGRSSALGVEEESSRQSVSRVLSGRPARRQGLLH